MFKNIGKKIRVLAMVLCWIGIAFSVLAGVVFILSGAGVIEKLPIQVTGGADIGTMLIVFGVVSILLGSLMSWVGSFLLYGFGKLVEETEANGARLEQLQNTLVGTAGAADAKRDQIARMLMENRTQQANNNANRAREPWHPPVSAGNNEKQYDNQYGQRRSRSHQEGDYQAAPYQAPNYQTQLYPKPYQTPAGNQQDLDVTVATGGYQR